MDKHKLIDDLLHLAARLGLSTYCYDAGAKTIHTAFAQKKALLLEYIVDLEQQLERIAELEAELNSCHEQLGLKPGADVAEDIVKRLQELWDANVEVEELTIQIEELENEIDSLRIVNHVLCRCTNRIVAAYDEGSDAVGDLELMTARIIGERDSLRAELAKQRPEEDGNAICVDRGHPHYGSDEAGPRCFCGQRRDFQVLEGK